MTTQPACQHFWRHFLSQFARGPFFLGGGRKQKRCHTFRNEGLGASKQVERTLYHQNGPRTATIDVGCYFIQKIAIQFNIPRKWLKTSLDNTHEVELWSCIKFLHENGNSYVKVTFRICRREEGTYANACASAYLPQPM